MTEAPYGQPVRALTHVSSLSRVISKCLISAKGSVAGMVLFTLVIGGFYVGTTTKSYTVAGSIQLGPNAGVDRTTALQNVADAISSAEVLLPAAKQIRDLHLALFNDMDPGKALGQKLAISIDSARQRVKVSLRSPYPHEGAAAVNAVLESFVALHPRAPGAGLHGFPSVVLADPGVLPDGPSPAIVLALSGALGFVAGLVLALSRLIFRQRVRAVGPMEEVAGMAVAGRLPLLSRQLSVGGRGLAAYIDPRGQAARTCRRAWRVLAGETSRAESRSFLVTSPSAGDGRSTAALNLAVTLASSGIAVVLVDGDAESPVLHKFLGTPAEAPGLSEALANPSQATGLVQATHIPDLHLLSSGRALREIGEGLGALAMEKVLVNLGEKYLRVVIDAGPALDNGPVAELAARCRATLVVLHERRTALADARKCRRQLEDAGAAVVALFNARHPVKRPVRSRARLAGAGGAQGHDEIYSYGRRPQENPA